MTNEPTPPAVPGIPEEETGQVQPSATGLIVADDGATEAAVDAGGKPLGGDEVEGPNSQ